MMCFVSHSNIDLTPWNWSRLLRIISFALLCLVGLSVNVLHIVSFTLLGSEPETTENYSPFTAGWSECEHAAHCQFHTAWNWARLLRIIQFPLLHLTALSVNMLHTVFSVAFQFYDLFEIGIRQCRSSGIDCKIHGLSIVGHRRTEDEEINWLCGIHGLSIVGHRRTEDEEMLHWSLGSHWGSVNPVLGGWGGGGDLGKKMMREGPTLPPTRWVEAVLVKWGGSGEGRRRMTG